MGADIAEDEQREIRRAMQLDLPVIIGEPIPFLYVQMDGTGVPVVKKETEGRKGKTDGQPAHTREVKLGCVFTQTAWDHEGYAELAQSLEMRIATGENEYNKHAFMDLLLKKGADVVQPDNRRAGGPTEWMEIAAIADEVSHICESMTHVKRAASA